jgi:hypothetical protein
MTTRVDIYLTRKAAAVWSDALVVRVDEHAFVLQRPGQEDLELGHTLTSARQALYAVIRHHKATTGKQD